MAGKLVHFELPSADPDRAKAFWTGVFGWEFSDPMGMEYFMVKTGDDQGGAVFKADDRTGAIIYFDTDDIDSSLAKVGESGGEAGDKTPIPNVGWFAHCSDTEGNAFSLFQSDESVTA